MRCYTLKPSICNIINLQRKLTEYYLQVLPQLWYIVKYSVSHCVFLHDIFPFQVIIISVQGHRDRGALQVTREASSWKSSLKMVRCCHSQLSTEVSKGATCLPVGRTWMMLLPLRPAGLPEYTILKNMTKGIWTGVLSWLWPYQPASAHSGVLSTKGTHGTIWGAWLTLGGLQYVLWRYYCALKSGTICHVKRKMRQQWQGSLFLHTIKWAVTNMHEKDREPEIKMLPCWNLESLSLNVHLYLGFS